MAGKIYRAREAALVSVNGQPQMIAAGATVREGHPLLTTLPGLFEPFGVDYEWEPGPEPDPPAEPDPLAPKTPRARGSAAK